MYTRVDWVNGPTTPMNDTNLNNLDAGIDNLYTWVEKNDTNDTESFTIFDFVFADTSFAVFTMNLPTTPTMGDMVRICDATGSFETNNFTVGYTDANIMGLSEDFVLDQSYACVELTYSTSHGWVITNKT